MFGVWLEQGESDNKASADRGRPYRWKCGKQPRKQSAIDLSELPFFIAKFQEFESGKGKRVEIDWY